MATAHTELLEIILRECAAAQGRPWYPSAFASATGVPREPLEACLDQLRLNGLVQLTPWVQGHGQGYQLTPAGAEVLRQPRLLAKLREGEVPQVRLPAAAEPAPSRHALAGLRGEKVRNALLDDSRPLVTQALVAANVLWFLVGGAVYVHFGGVFGDYATGSGGIQLSKTYDYIGSLARPDLVNDHQWWRLLSYGFVHGGFIHLLMNMYGLFIIGPLVERMWGRAAFLAIYLLSCIGGGAFAVVLTPHASLVGASGAICGLLGSMLTWLVLNKRHLPEHIVANWQRNILINIVLIAIISFLPGVSWAGHLGGGVIGAVVSVPLNLAHFGEGRKKLLGWLGALGLTAVGFFCLLSMLSRPLAAATPAPDDLQTLILQGEEIAVDAWNLESKVLNSGPKGLDEPTGKGIRAKLLGWQSRLEENAAALAKAGPFRQPEFAATMKSSLDFLQASSQMCGKTAKALEPDSPWPPSDLNALRAELAHVKELYQTFGEAWRKFQELPDGK
jgi:membrane associated rhomboid family serine protease